MVRKILYILFFCSTIQEINFSLTKKRPSEFDANGEQATNQSDNNKNVTVADDNDDIYPPASSGEEEEDGDGEKM